MSLPLKKLEVSNLVLRFGEDLVLMDLFDEVVKPSFFDKSLCRTYEETTYLFINQQIVLLDDQSVGIAGRFVKNTMLEQEQVLVDGKLIEAAGSIPSAPSAFFLLVLNSHRLLYVKENTASPSSATFRATLAKFLAKKHDEFIRALHKESKKDGDSQTMNGIRVKYPRPNLRITPVGTASSVDDFLKKFETLQTFRAELRDTNNELDFDAMFADVRTADEKMNSEKTTLTFQSSQGLDIKQTAKQIVSLSKQANSHIKVKGLDAAGGVISGTEEDFKLDVPLKWGVRPGGRAAALIAFAKFKTLVDTGTIDAPETKRAAQKIAKIIKEFLL